MYEVAVLGKGKHFGELALTTNKPRAATVRAITTTHLMVLSKHDYMKVLSHFEEANLREFVGFLRNLPAFMNWPVNSLTRLTYYLPKKTFLRNQVVFKEGDPSSHAFIVLEGEFEIVKRMLPLKDKEEDWNKLVGPEKMLADAALRLEKNMIKHNNYIG